MTFSRRQTLAWMLSVAALGGAQTRPSRAQTSPQTAPKLSPVAPFPALKLPLLDGPGYGTDPDTMNPKAPWPLTLAPAHRALINAAGNIILPADDASKGAGELDIAAFFDEWISAPYPDQQLDRPQFLTLFLWLDAQSRLLSGADFSHADTSVQTRILDALLDDSAPAEACDVFAWFRALMIMGYFSLPDTGIPTEAPILGDYPGPSPEAMNHLNSLLVSLDLPPY